MQNEWLTWVDARERCWRRILRDNVLLKDGALCSMKIAIEGYTVGHKGSRLNSRLMWPDTPRFWPEMKTRCRFSASCRRRIAVAPYDLLRYYITLPL
jgi:hypothetical protein